MKAKTYLHFNGNCEEAMDFYADILGGEITQKLRFKDAPESDLQFPQGIMNQIMHSCLQAGSFEIMASDYVSEHPFKQGNNFAVALNTNDEEEAYGVFNGLSENGQILMPFEEAFWGGKFGMLMDKFGVSWMVSLEEEASIA